MKNVFDELISRLDTALKIKSEDVSIGSFKTEKQVDQRLKKNNTQNSDCGKNTKV